MLAEIFSGDLAAESFQRFGFAEQKVLADFGRRSGGRLCEAEGFGKSKGELSFASPDASPVSEPVEIRRLVGGAEERATRHFEFYEIFYA
jgi:hypothetical protein